MAFPQGQIREREPEGEQVQLHMCKLYVRVHVGVSAYMYGKDSHVKDPDPLVGCQG